MTVIEWIQYADIAKHRGKRFRCPTYPDLPRWMFETNQCLALHETNPTYNSALITVLGYGQSFWNTVNKHAKEGSVLSHGLVGNVNASMNEEMQMTLHYFFAGLESLAEPTPM